MGGIIGHDFQGFGSQFIHIVKWKDSRVWRDNEMFNLGYNFTCFDIFQKSQWYVTEG